ncbi:MAG TPA: DUF1501 domain-containing protein [Candidatus Baltobacteraceae bacterium]|jgi:uncharacterized protein (DUF1501 family)|nr:DUF1501 domain-containing protein [Candidatus Baltobacteraceae bacterium]
MKRGRFLLGSLGGLSVVGTFDHLFAQAFAAPVLAGLPGSDDNRVLVLLNFEGGNDGLNTLVPLEMPDYYRYRPTLGIPAGDVLALNAQIGLNPEMGAFKRMFDAGKVAIVQGVGYPKPDHSHFRSQQIWQTAQPDAYVNTGWIGRYLDAADLPKENLFNAVALAPVLPQCVLAQHVDVPAFTQLSGYGLVSDRRRGQRGEYQAMLAEAREPFDSPYLPMVAEIEDHAQRGAEELPQLIAGYTTDASYPATPLGRSLALAAQIIGSRTRTRVIYVRHGSFDTHIAQRGTHDRLLREFSDAIAAFYADLSAHGNDKRTLTMSFSEFGRRVAENAGRGTDHGEAAPLFLIGGAVKGGIYGEHPSLENLDNGDVTFTTDFRSVYATVLEKWFGRSGSEILNGAYPLISALA